MQDLLVEIGLEAERVRMFHVSSAMAGQFAEAAAEMTEQIAALGPNPLRLVETGQNGAVASDSPEQLSTEESKT